MRILIAEDELVSLKIVESILEPLSDPEFALNGAEAFRKFQNAFDSGDKFDLICMDVNMPVQDGLDCLARIRNYEEVHGIVGADAVKVLMVTGVSDPKTLYDAVSTGCTAFLTKPVNRKQFVSELERLGLLAQKNEH